MGLELGLEQSVESRRAVPTDGYLSQACPPPGNNMCRELTVLIEWCLNQTCSPIPESLPTHIQTNARFHMPHHTVERERGRPPALRAAVLWGFRLAAPIEISAAPCALHRRLLRSRTIPSWRAEKTHMVSEWKNSFHGLFSGGYR